MDMKNFKKISTFFANHPKFYLTAAVKEPSGETVNVFLLGFAFL